MNKQASFYRLHLFMSLTVKGFRLFMNLTLKGFVSAQPSIEVRYLGSVAGVCSCRRFIVQCNKVLHTILIETQVEHIWSPNNITNTTLTLAPHS